MIDFSNGENVNRSQVCSYMEMLRETASVLKDINIGEATWGDYRKLKENRDALGKEILQNYDAHKWKIKYNTKIKQKGNRFLRKISNSLKNAKN